MKRTSYFYGLILFILIFPSITSAQKNAPIKELFFNLPIDSAGEILIKRINENPIFKDIVNRDIRSSDLHVGSYYEGEINLKDFPENLPKPEKATIKLEGHIGFNAKSKLDFTSSDLILEYLFANSQLAETYFSYAFDKIKSLSKDTSDAQFGFPSDEDYAYGKSILLHKRKKLPEIYILKRDLGNGQYVSIIYRREGY